MGLATISRTRLGKCEYRFVADRRRGICGWDFVAGGGGSGQRAGDQQRGGGASGRRRYSQQSRSVGVRLCVGAIHRSRSGFDAERHDGVQYCGADGGSVFRPSRDRNCDHFAESQHHRPRDRHEQGESGAAGEHDHGVSGWLDGVWQRCDAGRGAADVCRRTAENVGRQFACRSIRPAWPTPTTRTSSPIRNCSSRAMCGRTKMSS